MHRRFRISAALAALALAAAVPSVRGQTAEWHGVQLEAALWAVAGEVGFKEGLEREPIVSKLQFPLTGLMAELRGLYAFPFLDQRLSVRGRFARSLVVEGDTKDTDYDRRGRTAIYSVCDGDGTVTLGDADLLFLQPVGARVAVGGFAGYGWQRFDYENRNLRQKEPARYDRGGLVSTYEVTFQGPRFGGLGRWEILRGFFLTGEATIWPYVAARADADWVLRDYTFDQEADGWGAGAKVRTTYAFTDTLAVFGGMHITALVADRNGQESGQEGGKPAYHDQPWVREITSQYAGFDLGAMLTF
jgi:hypothetical protein